MWLCRARQKHIPASMGACECMFLAGCFASIGYLIVDFFSTCFDLLVCLVDLFACLDLFGMRDSVYLVKSDHRTEVVTEFVGFFLLSVPIGFHFLHTNVFIHRTNQNEMLI